jgi:hypothetical protein
MEFSPKRKRPKIHPELPLGKNHERGTPQTMIWHWLKYGVELPARLK